MMPAFAIFTRRSWHSTIEAQDAMMPSAAMLSTISKASPGWNALSATPKRQMKQVSRIPPYGTPCLDIRAVNLGALPFIAIDRRMRPVEYSPAFRLENAAVRTTMFMMSPAPANPILEKNVTNGLSPPLYDVYGSS